MIAKEKQRLTTKIKNMSLAIKYLEKAFLDIEKSMETKFIKTVQNAQQQNAWRTVFKAPPSNYKILKKRLKAMADSLKILKPEK
jgi:protein gp37